METKQTIKATTTTAKKGITNEKQPAPGSDRTPGKGNPPTTIETLTEETATPTATIPPVAVQKITSEIKAQNRGQLPKVKQIKETVADQTAVVMLALLDGIATVLAGPTATMTESERAMLSEPLARMLAKLELSQNKVIQQYSDPVLFLMGLIAWGSRVARDRAKQRKEKETPLEASQRTEEPAPQEKAGHPVMREEIDLATMLTAPTNIARNMQASIMEAKQ